MGQKHSKGRSPSAEPDDATTPSSSSSSSSNFVAPHTVRVPCASAVIRRIASSLSEQPRAELQVGAPRPPASAAREKKSDEKKFGLVVPLQGTLPVTLVGGKAARLADLAALEADGVRVPKGVAVTTAVFRSFVEKTLGLRFSCSLPEAAFESAKQRILTAELPAEVRANLDVALQAFAPGTLFAVRSSATLEDGSSFSLAGLAESFLFVQAQDVHKMILGCWASLFDKRVAAYLTKTQQIDRGVEMAVVVQEMINPTCAGVFFTLHPTVGTDDCCSCEVIYGLGEGLVGGELTPYSYLVNWVDESVREERKVVQNKKFVRSKEKASGLDLVETTDQERSAAPLTSQQILELTNVCLAVAVFYGAPQDIEFCFVDGKPVLLQTRPITSFHANGLKSHQWFEGFARKSWLAMCCSSISGYLASKLHGTRVPYDDERKFVRPIFGVAYVNKEVLALGHDSGKSSEFKRWRETCYKTVDSYVAHAKEQEPLLSHVLQNISHVSNSDLNELVYTLLEERVELGFLSFLVGEQCRNFEKLLSALLEEHGNTVAIDDCLVGVRPRSTMLVNNLNDLASVLRRPEHKRARDIICSDPIDWEGLKKESFYAKHFEQFIREFFFQTDNDEDILEERLIDNPFPAILFLRVSVAGNSPGGAVVAEKKPIDLASLDSDIATVVRRLHLFLNAKEEIHETYTRANYFLCKVLQHWSSKVLGLQENDIFYASNAAIARYVFNGQDLTVLVKEINQHRTIRKMFANFKIPAYIYNGRPGNREPEISDDSADAQGRFVLSGVGGAAGKFEGIVRVVPSLAESGSLRRGEILVTSMTSPAWTPLFSVIGAVICEHGGRLSHCSVVARELDLPCVLSIPNVMELLKTGTRVVVDGGAGTVTVLGEEATQDLSKSVDLSRSVNKTADPDLDDLETSQRDLSESRNV